jgi:hypothetical protein
MSVNVRWNGRGWPRKVPRSPVASPEEKIMEMITDIELKNGGPKGTVKDVWQKTGMANLKKKVKIILFSLSFRGPRDSLEP